MASLIITVIALIVGILSLLVTYMVYIKNHSADVVVYCQIDKKRQTIINLVIHNIGKGVAKDIDFICDVGVPKDAFGLTGLKDPLEFYTSGAFVKGLPILFPDEKLIYTWGQLGGLREALNGNSLELKVLFNSPLPLYFSKNKKMNVIFIDPTAYEGVDISEPSFEKEVKKSLKEIATSLKEISRK